MRDQNVIKGYIRQRNELDAEEVEEPENLVLTGDPEKDAIVKKKYAFCPENCPLQHANFPAIAHRLAEQLEKLRKNQERRLQRKNAKMGVAGDVFLPGGKKIKNETTVSSLPMERLLSALMHEVRLHSGVAATVARLDI